jgi:protein-tyrosine phosphatase
MDLTSRLLALLGLDFDYSITMRGERFDQITETLYVGARPRPDDVPALAAAGITHVVSCLEEAELAKVELEGLDVQTLGIAIRDGMDQDIAASFPRLFDFAARAGERAGSKVLVHCEAGVSRSATLATALLMKSTGKTFIDAFGQLRDRRAGVLPNIGFASQLQHLEHALCPDRRASSELSSLARYLHEVCRVPIEVEVIEEVLAQHDYDAPHALRALFGGEIPRVVQGVRF